VAHPPIEFVTPVRKIAFPSEWYEANSEDHFWFQWRARVANSLVEGVGLRTDQELTAFDIGCGTGITCRQLSRTTKWIFDGADLNIEALTRCDTGQRRVLYYDILDRRPEFRERYDVIILFDVIEHIEHTEPFLDAAFFHLKPGGVALVNVPALTTLYGRYDTAAGHFRRYNCATLAAEFAFLDATVLDQMYWGFSMVPLLFVRKQLLGRLTSEEQAIRTGFLPPSPFAHKLLKAAMVLEMQILKRPPFGSSVISAIRKDR
jgi:SAM-dependent methyltransferase